MGFLARIGWTGVAVVALAGSACVDIVQAAQYVDRQEKQFDVTGAPDVSLSTFDGSIEVQPWDRQQVSVTIERHARSKDAADRLDVRATQDGNKVTVEIRRPAGGSAGFGWGDRASAKLIVQMPASGTLVASSGDGSIDVRGLDGRCDLKSGDGSITVHGVSGDLKAHTGDGSIDLADASGAIDADSGDGSISVTGRISTVRVRTGDGSVHVDAAPGSSATGDWDIVTGDGSVTLALPAGFSGDLDAHSGDGRIVMHGITVSVTGTISKSTVRGRIGSGGRPVRVRTGDGSITLNGRD
jgi:hypothetical protein